MHFNSISCDPSSVGVLASHRASERSEKKFSLKNEPAPKEVRWILIYMSGSANAICVHCVAGRAHFAKVCLNDSEYSFKVNDNKFI